ncbi:hypothetical protein SAMN04488595_103176 [Ralstonia sp. 25mfcol4.1]|uniref:hypothetical protein n=1 Tax=Burkholderiaceae TaxID=119060 RepID=UPI00042605A6|nr:hypothetical protein [Ralstonia sp. 25mfcol4.1]SDO94671.1 hypothetical protein SAMN04488595_103176 [Ralstonia sp. 25mfcol4.1]
MPASKHRKNRRAHQPRVARLPSCYRFSNKAEVDLQLIPHVELSKILDGTATENAWFTLGFRVNVGQLAAALYFAENRELREAMDAAVEAIAAVGKRYRARGRLGVTGDEYRVIGRALNLTDEIQRMCTRRELLEVSLAVEDQQNHGDNAPRWRAVHARIEGARDE